MAEHIITLLLIYFLTIPINARIMQITPPSVSPIAEIVYSLFPVKTGTAVAIVVQNTAEIEF